MMEITLGKSLEIDTSNIGAFKSLPSTLVGLIDACDTGVVMELSVASTGLAKDEPALANVVVRSNGVMQLTLGRDVVDLKCHGLVGCQALLGKYDPEASISLTKHSEVEDRLMVIIREGELAKQFFRLLKLV